MKIKDIPIEFRPRERLKLKGKENLSDIELLSIILKTGTKEKSVEDLSIELLNKYKLSDLKEIDINELIKIKGLGEVKAIELIASIELGKRIFMKKKVKKPVKRNTARNVKKVDSSTKVRKKIS